ncbi:hypothetical protein PDESU_02806 [Pontiella desulfatans]|uniref:Uncharacterized protein n=1 Tax=Pontiella desulfatans TaxID=2750659 RepID=A0A6C2U311_PONDE|nr:hypothetical protein [Pontiella desulfatans]VGO14247.1 hypothetical protein PDESU_02806 [Pontiella desulfatans]
MKKTLLFALAVLALAATGCGDREARAKEKKANTTFMFWCFRKEIVSDNYHVPDMRTAAAAQYLQNKMKAVPGYDDSSYDLEKNILTVSYKSSTVRKMNFEEAIAEAGFPVNLRPADPKAKIPEGVK